MQAIVLKYKDTFRRYPYAKYIYDLIVEIFCAQGGEVVLWDAKAKMPPSNKKILYVIDVPGGNVLSYQWWQSVQWPKMVRSVQAEWIFYMDGTLPTVRMPVKQWLLMPDAEQMFQKEMNAKALLARRKIWQRNIASVDKAFTYSKTAADALAPDSVEILPPFPDACFRKLSWEEKELVKETFSDGEEYFLMDAAISREQEVIHWLKAFSHFKKWQKSAMKLLLVVTGDLGKNARFNELFSTYHFRQDVRLLVDPPKDDFGKILASAYGFLELSGCDGRLPGLLAAAQTGTLAIAYSSPSTGELPDGFIFDVPGKDFGEIGQVMIAVYKSENLRARHIKAGTDFASSFDDHFVRATLGRLLAGQV